MALIKSGSEAMEKTVIRSLTWSLPQSYSFVFRSSIFLVACGAILYFALAADYPAVHDALHNVRHALAVVPCH
jgi:cobalt transporter subunit CbtB